MKEKTKKILAGIGIGLTLGTAGAFMTGCSSDITFNQKDLDQAISNINEYLETQNNYSSEFARNTLNGYLMNALNDSARKNIEIISEEIMYDSFGNEQKQSKGTYKYYNNGSMVKEYTTSSNTSKYRESVLGSDNKYDCVTYTKNSQGNKTFVRENDINNARMGSISEVDGALNYNSILTDIIMLLSVDGEEGIKLSDFIMDQKSNNTIVFKCLGINPTYMALEDYKGTALIASLELEFVDGNLVKYSSVVTARDNATYESSTLSAQTVMTINHNASDFTFDKTGYVESLGDE